MTGAVGSGRFVVAFACATIFVLAAPASGAKSIWLSPDQFDRLHIVLATDAPEPAKVAAQRFADHWKRATGFTPTQSSEASADAAANVWIGGAGRKAFPEEFARRRPGDNGCFVLTLPRRNDQPGERHLLLVGGGPRGTVVAEWAFFERFLGARVFTPDVMRFPKPESGIPVIDWHYEPPFEYRDTNYRMFLENPWLASLNDLNGQWSKVPDTFGGHIGFVHGLEGFGHTFYHFVNPEEYFDKHPEYFAEINGERIKDAQLCLTNPDVLAITIDRARRYLREAKPNERILSVSQMDYFWFDSWCTCEKCKAVDEAEGSQSGTIVRFVNAVADAIKPEFPDALIDTFAYLYSRKPPKLTHPRDNVLIRLCAIEADYGRPLGDRRSPDNRAFVHDLKGWRKIAKHVWVWDYTQNWRAFQAPHPNLRVLQPNLALFARLGIEGVFEQASPHSRNSDFEFLKAYIIGRGLRDPNFDWKKEAAAFIDAYYGEAAPFIIEYQRLLDDRLNAWDKPLYFVNDLNWIDSGTVVRAQDIFARAFATVHDDVILERLRAAYLPVQYAALICPPDVAQTPDAYVFTRPPSQTFDEYWATAKALGVTHLNDYPIEQLRERLNGETPPRREVAPIVKLRNDTFEIWVVPARGGAIVRWRELATGREWLDGYDDIRSTSGRIQDWATTDDDRWAEPEPAEENHVILDKNDDSITLELQLDNGLALRKRIKLTSDGIETGLTLQNSSTNPVVPKIAMIADFATEDLARPAGWMLDPSGRTYSRSAIAFTDGPSETRQRFTPQGIALRFFGIGRTVIEDLVTGERSDRLTIKREPDSRATRFTVDLDRTPLGSGESRTTVVRQRITAQRPPQILVTPKP